MKYSESPIEFTTPDCKLSTQPRLNPSFDFLHKLKNQLFPEETPVIKGSEKLISGIFSHWSMHATLVCTP